MLQIKSLCAKWNKISPWKEEMVHTHTQKKNLLFAHPFPFSFRLRIWKRTSFWSSDPSGWLQAEQGNFTGFLINIQPLSRASLGHLVVDVYSLVQDWARNFINTAVNDKSRRLTLWWGSCCSLHPEVGATGRWMQGEKLIKAHFNRDDVSLCVLIKCKYGI